MLQKNKSLLWTALIVCLSLISVQIGYAQAAVTAQAPTPIDAALAKEISTESARAIVTPEGHPLPLATHWNVGTELDLPQYAATGISAATQMDYLAKGHHILPTFNWPQTDQFFQTTWKPAQQQQHDDWLKAHLAYFEGPIKQLAAAKLPIAFLATQWECGLTDDKEYFDLPAEKNPNVVDPKGNILKKVDPFGPVELWRQVGKRWSDSQVMKQLQTWYPDPPVVVLYSNNEHAKLQWDEAEQSQRYLDKYGKGHDDEFKRKVVMDAYVERYRALQEGMREGFISPAWKQHCVFIGYDANGPYWCKAWDGGTPSYYTNNWQSTTDYNVDSQQLHTMHWIPLLDEMHKINPAFRFEMSTWDGDVGDQPNNKRKYYASQGQTFTPDRYGGYVQFGLWSLRPRTVMEFRGSGELRANIEPYYLPIVEAVDRVYTNPILRKFWRKGELVPNRAHPHADFEINPPKVMPKEDHWFLLDTSVDPPRPWKPRTELPVFALAMSLGTAPDREWLLYTYAPLGGKKNVKVTIPDYGAVTVDASVSGSFYHVAEKTKQVTAVVIGGPATVNATIKSPFANVNEAVAFTAVDPYSPKGEMTNFRWNFGDGTTGTGLQATHVYQKAGQYLVSLKGTDEQGATANKLLTLFVGIGPEPGLVLRYTMAKTTAASMPDASGKNNIGFIHGGKWVDDPQRGSVLELDGKTEYIGIINSPDINTGGPYTNRTISLWFKATDEKRRQMIYEEGGSGNGLNIYLLKGKLYGGVWASAVWPGSWIPYTDVMPGQWYHVALVLRNAGPAIKQEIVEFYVNGALVATAEGAQIPGHVGDINYGRNGNTLYADQHGDYPSDYFAGQLGQLAIYNKALSADEIAKMAK